MASSRVFLGGFLLLVLLQGYCWAQRGRLDATNPFEGVRYLNSRVASAPRSRNILNKTRPSWGDSYPTIIRTSSPTFSVPVTTTTTPRPTRYWRPPTTTPTTTAPKPTRRPHWQDTDFEAIPSTPRMKIERVSGDTPGYLVTIEEDRPRKHGHHGRYNPHVKPDRYSAAESSSEYRGVEEGSYYDRSGASAPKENRGTVFDWDTARPHHHRHHHGTTPAPLRYTDQSGSSSNYAAFESRGATYTPAPTTRRPHRRQSTTPLPTRAPTTTRYRRHEGPKQSSVSYHQRQKERPAGSVRRTSESVSYVAGSYFPTSGGSRKPTTGFAVRPPRPLAPAPVTTTPVPVTTKPAPVTTTTSPIVRRHYPDAGTRRQEEEEEDYERRDDEYDEAGARHQHLVDDGDAKRTRDEDDVWNDNVHPFAAYAGKY